MWGNPPPTPTPQNNKCLRLTHRNRDLDIKPIHVKNQLLICINSLIENPSFDSQTKDTLMSKPSQYGSHCVLTESFLNRIATETDIINAVVNGALAR